MDALLAKSAPNTYRLDIPPSWGALSEFNVERLRHYLFHPPELERDAEDSGPGLVQSIDGRLEHEVEAILKFSMRIGHLDVLICSTSLDASVDTCH